MTDLTPSPKQLQSWIDKISHPNEQGVGPSLKDKELACLAFRAGADQELEACLRLIEIEVCDEGYELSRYIRATRRPKPPSLAEVALKAIDSIDAGTDRLGDSDLIRRALERLQELEGAE